MCKAAIPASSGAAMLVPLSTFRMRGPGTLDSIDTPGADKSTAPPGLLAHENGATRSSLPMAPTLMIEFAQAGDATGLVSKGRML